MTRPTQMARNGFALATSAEISHVDVSHALVDVRESISSHAYDST
jgi:hypothetical protein